ncbi:MAG: hypothetical protein WBW53_18560 [Terriglobales bacterium]
MTNHTGRPRGLIAQINMSEFWSGDLGLTLVTLSLTILIFVITPMREAAIPGRMFVQLAVVTGEEIRRFNEDVRTTLRIVCKRLAQLSQLRTFFGFFVMIFVLKSCVFIVGI